jgi:hypothetical protein
MNCSAVETRCGAHPFLQAFGGVPDLPQHQQRLGDRGLGGAAMTEIRRDCLIEAGLIFRNDSPQPRQPVEPFLKRRRRTGPRQLEHGVKGVIQSALPGTSQRLVHGVSSAVPWLRGWAFAPFLARALSEGDLAGNAGF